MKTIYLARPVLNPLPELEALRKQLKLAPKREKLHVTLVFSKTRVDWSNPVFAPKEDTITLSEASYQLVTFDDHVALKVSSSQLSGRFVDLTRAGAQTDFEGFNPHITLGTFTPDSRPIPEWVTLTSHIVLGPEERDDRPEPSMFDKNFDAAIARAAVGFANDYGPLPAANDGDEKAQSVMAKRLLDILDRESLVIRPKHVIET